MREPLNTLLYKRTHKGDPGTSGVFGSDDCMGRVRGFNFDAVIGVGGKIPDRGHEEIAYKVNWVGIKPRVIGRNGRGPLLKFEYFVRPEGAGPDLRKLAPGIYSYMFEDKHVRLVLSNSLTTEMQDEVWQTLKWAKGYKPRQSRPAERMPPPKGGCR